MTDIKLHGALGEEVGNSCWRLKVSSVKEAIHAIDTMTKRKLSKTLIHKDKQNIRYRVLIDGKDFLAEKKFHNNLDSEEEVREDVKNVSNSELCMEKEIKTIDVIPMIEGADEVFMTIMGAILMIVGFVLLAAGNPLGAVLISVGSALMAAGITAMLMEWPEFKEIRAIEGMTTASYLFNGPVNTIKEGGPVPVVYGQLLAGSQVIAAYYDIDDVKAEENSINT